MVVKRLLVVVAGALVAANIWTGAPLLALWVGARIVGQTTLSMTAVGIVVAVLATTIFAMGMLLVWLNETYRRLADQRPQRREPQWLSHFGEESTRARERPALTPVEWAIVLSVQLAVIAFVVWFLFIAGSPLPANSPLSG
jgi:uncharacterized membrane protein YbaN (DUF454 family)